MAITANMTTPDGIAITGAYLVVKNAYVKKFDGEWIYEELYVIIKETQEKINLLDQSLEGI